MFWKTQRAGEAELSQRGIDRSEVGEYLRARLRLALEFATLGEYEGGQASTSGRKVTCAAGAGRAGDVDHVHVARDAARPHAQARTDNCETMGTAAPASCGVASVVRRVPKPPAGSRSSVFPKRRRGGQVGRTDQPCVWTGS